jgi:TPR repeat protein
MMQVVEELCAGNANTYNVLSKCLSKNIDMEEQPAKKDWMNNLFFELEMCVRKGVTQAMVLLGYAYLDGKSVKQDTRKAANYARRAASLGDARGEVLLGYMYANGFGLKLNYQRAQQWFNSAIQKGNATALNNMGAVYEEGLGVKKNIPLAIKYYKQAAEKGNELAKNNLAKLQGVSQK